MKIGVSISTKDRPEVLSRALAHHAANRPVDVECVYVLVDDGSELPAIDVIFKDEALLEAWGGELVNLRHDTSWGIARSKNHGLAYLMDAGCDQLFLFDDDAYPVSPDWAWPYITHPEGHLQFNYAGGNDHDAPLTPIYRDGQTLAHHASRGVALYFTRKVIDAVGGMDPQYQYGFEHVEHSERIHNAGYTTWVAQTPVHPGEPRIVALDERQEVDSAITAYARRMHTTLNLALLDSHQGRTDFISYREPTNQVLTSLWTGVTDTHPGRAPWVCDDEYLTVLLASLGHYRSGTAPWAIDYTVLHNDVIPNRQDDPRWRLTSVDFSTEYMTPYVQRWVSYRSYLINTPTVEKVWIVDCSDVEYLQRPQDPFEMIEPGRLYIGFEDKIAGCDWMLNHHSASKTWLTNHSRYPLYNAGVLGGDRHTVLKFIDHLLACYRRAVVACTKDEVGDMGYIQQAVDMMSEPVITGPHVVSVFKAYQYDSQAMFRHK